MNLISIYLITTITSIFFELKNEFKIFKDFADIGYKINFDKLKNIQNEIPVDTNTSTNIYISMFIPFYNLYTVIKRTHTYENNKQLIYDTFDKLGALDEMNENEKNEYAQNPTAWKAILITAKSKEEIKQEATQEIKKLENIEQTEQVVKMIIIEENNETNSIIIQLNTQNNAIKVLSIEGPIKNEQQEQVTAYILEHMDKIMTEKNITITKTNEYIQITLNKIKPKTKLERYKELKESLEKNGYLFGEEMCEYKDLQEELKLTLK